MNNRPTPETDAAASPHIGFYSCATVTANFARRLEIERDEAREELHDIRLNLGADAEGLTLVHAVCVLQQERDEARDTAQKSKAYKRVLKETNARLKRERDEAREAFKEMWRSGDAFLPHVDSETINRWRKAAGWEETK